MGRAKRIWYLSPMRAAKVQASLRIRAVHQNRRCSLIQAVSQEEPSDRKPDPWPLWMAGHAQLKLVMTECSKTQIRLTGLVCHVNAITNEPHHEKPSLCHMRTTKIQIGLIRAFFVHCLDSIISLVSLCLVSWLQLVSVAEQASLSLTWLKTPKTGFLMTMLKWLKRLKMGKKYLNWPMELAET